MAKVSFRCLVMAFVQFIGKGMWFCEEQGTELYNEMLESIEIKFVILSFVHEFEVDFPH